MSVHQVAAKKWDMVSKMFAHDDEAEVRGFISITDHTDMSVAMLSKKERPAFVSRTLVGTIADLFRMEDRLADVRALVLSCGSIIDGFRDLALKQEMDDLRCLLTACGPQPAQPADLEQAVSAFATTKTRKLHKAVQMFPTGIALQAVVAKILDAHARDLQCDQKLTEGSKIWNECPGVGRSDVVITADCTIPETERLRYAELRSVTAALLAQASPNWLEAHKEDIDKLMGPLQRLLTAADASVAGLLEPLFPQMLNEYVDAIDDSSSASEMPGKTFDDFEAAREAYFAAFPDVRKMMAGLAADKDISAMEQQCVDRRQDAQDISMVFAFLSGHRAIDAHCVELQRVVEHMLDLPADSQSYLAAAARYADFSGTTKQGLAAALVSHLLKEVPFEICEKLFWLLAQSGPDMPIVETELAAALACFSPEAVTPLRSSLVALRRTAKVVLSTLGNICEVKVLKVKVRERQLWRLAYDTAHGLTRYLEHASQNDSCYHVLFK